MISLRAKDEKDKEAAMKAVKFSFLGKCCGTCKHWEDILGGYSTAMGCGKRYEVTTESYNLCKDHSPIEVVEFIKFPEEY